MQETGAGSLTITAFHDNVVTGTSAAAGILVNTAIFDATPGAPVNPVPGGTTVIGTSGDRIGGAGLTLSGVTGALNFANLAAGTIGAGDLDIFTDSGAALTASGTGGFDLDVTANAGVLVANAGAAAVLSTLDADLQWSSLTSTNSGATGVSLTNVTGTFSAPTGSSITNATGTDFLISGGTAAVTYGGTITDDVGQLVSVSGATGGTKSFTGAITDGNDGDGSGISLTGNAGATIRFSGGLTLSTGANPALHRHRRRHRRSLRREPVQSRRDRCSSQQSDYDHRYRAQCVEHHHWLESPRVPRASLGERRRERHSAQRDGLLRTLARSRRRDRRDECLRRAHSEHDGDRDQSHQYSRVPHPAQHLGAGCRHRKSRHQRQLRNGLRLPGCFDHRRRRRQR